MKNLFKGQTISLVACGLLLSTSMAFGADSIDGAFKEGKVSGLLTAYGLSHDGKGGGLDSDGGYTNAAISYETGSYMGLSAKASFIGGHAFSDGELLARRSRPGLRHRAARRASASRSPWTMAIAYSR